MPFELTPLLLVQQRVARVSTNSYLGRERSHELEGVPEEN